ncbi:MAG: tripartite tricarboxylate transporter TctB family protein [Rhodospirillales bacterium]|nr:tripartite tricarboxylate transporter TctB family protein [Rhodospirillales bacterium]
MDYRLRAVFGGGLFLLAAGLLTHSYDPHYEGMGIGAEFGPMFYPRILLILWMALSIGLIAEVFLFRQKDIDRQRWAKLLGALILVAGCTFLLNAIGFLFASLLFCVVACLFLGYREPVGLVLTGLVFPVFTWYLFHEVLLIRLPTSPWFTWI